MFTPPAKMHLDTAKAASNRMAPVTKDPVEGLSEANGAIPATQTSVASVTAPKGDEQPKEVASNKAPTPSAAKPQRQTHGARVPTGPIMSVGQLISGRTDAKGSVGSFETLEDYRGYLNNLSLGELHRHAVEEAKTVPIDDRNRLIRRLEGEWSTFASRAPGRKPFVPPQPKVLTSEQRAQNEALMRKMLRR